MKQLDRIHGWEASWAPYHEADYSAVLDQLSEQDVVYEIGAGDLRLARRIAQKVRQVFAVEMHPALVKRGLPQGLPANLTTQVGDARRLPVPEGTTVGVLLMRHCTHFALYARKLKEAGCRKLLTNARWRLDVETILLQAPRLPFRTLKIGWYACLCGATGFVNGPVELLTPRIATYLHEVFACPQCPVRV